MSNGHGAKVGDNGINTVVVGKMGIDVVRIDATVASKIY